MKKVLTLIAALAVAASLCSCGFVTQNNPAQSDIPASGSSDSADTNTDSKKTQNPAGEEYTYDHITLTLPEGFTVDESSAIPIAYGPDYPNKTDNITFSKSAADDINNYTKSVIEAQYKQLLQGFEEIDSFDKIKIDGKDAIEIEYEMSVNGIDIDQTQYYIFGDTFIDIVTFTDVTDTYDDAFEDCANSITVD